MSAELNKQTGSDTKKDGKIIQLSMNSNHLIALNLMELRYCYFTILYVLSQCE